MIIALEGADAAGKATQCRLLVERLRAAGMRTSSISFPDYTSVTGKLILEMLKGDSFVTSTAEVPEKNALALQALMTANRYEHYEKLSAFEDGVLVCDRYWLSGLVYGMADGLPKDWLLDIRRGLPKAHHLYLRVSLEESQRRRPEARDRFERDQAKQVRVRALYDALFKVSSPHTAASFATLPAELTGRLHVIHGATGKPEGVADRVSEVVDAIIRADGK